MKKIVSFALAGVLLSACGGGGTTALPSSGTGSGAAPTAKTRSRVTFTLKVPAHTQSSASTRKPQYIPAAMQSLAVTLTMQGSTPVSSPQPYAVNVSSCPTVSSIATCSLFVPASVGSDTFTVATYDQAQSSSTPTSLTGNVLSTASASTTVVLNTANTMSLTLDGVVKSISLTLGNASPLSGTDLPTIPLTVTAKDADTNVIISGTYSAPITLTNSDISGATTLSTTSVTGPSTVVTVHYTGAPATASFSATASGATAAPAIALRSQITRIIVAQLGGVVQAFQPNGSPYSPALTTVTGLDKPTGVALDAAGNIYVANQGTSISTSSITKYLPTGGAPILTLTSGLDQPQGVAVDATGKIYVANTGYTTPQIVIYPAGATSSTSPDQTINMSASGHADGVAVDAAGHIYSANSNGTVTVFSSDGLTSLATISAGGLTDASDVAVDASGKIYVANFIDGVSNNGFIATFTSSYGSTTPNITAGTGQPIGIAVDQTGNIYVANLSGNAISIYGSSGTLTPPNTPLTGLTQASGVAVY